MGSNILSKLGINLESLAQKKYDINSSLPWDFVETGLDKNWLINEYNAAHKIDKNSKHIVPTCQTGCVNCGVCSNFKTRKVMAKPFKACDDAQKILNKKRKIENIPQSEMKEAFRYRIKVTKTGTLKYFSHLDWQNTFQKSISRTNLKVAYSYGYNPIMRVSMGVALPLFCESECELVDLLLWENADIDYVKSEIQKALPNGAEVLSVNKIDRSADSIENIVSWAEYKVKIFNNSLYHFDEFVYNTNRVLSSDEILIEKKNKKGLVQKINIKKSIGAYRFENDCLFIVLKAGHSSDIPSVRADVVMNAIAPDVLFDITRTKFLTESLKEL